MRNIYLLIIPFLVSSLSVSGQSYLEEFNDSLIYSSNQPGGLTYPFAEVMNCEKRCSPIAFNKMEEGTITLDCYIDSEKAKKDGLEFNFYKESSLQSILFTENVNIALRLKSSFNTSPLKLELYSDNKSVIYESDLFSLQDDSEFYIITLPLRVVKSTKITKVKGLRLLTGGSKESIHGLITLDWININSVINNPVEHEGISYFKIYPNPAKEKIQFQFVNSEAVKYKIVITNNLLNNSVVLGEGKEKSIDNQYNLSQLQNGSYILHLYINDLLEKSEHLIINR